MISKEGYMDIKAMVRNGMTVRAISRRLGLHRNTVKKHLMSDDFPQYRKSRRRESILEPYTPMIRDYLEEDDYRATWLLERIRRAGYPGAYGIVRDYVRSIKQQKTRLAYVRFETEPGRQSQFDWADFQVVEPSGRLTTIFAFMLVLGFSRAAYVEFVERCTLESFLDGHIRAFRYLQGVPAESLYDNMKHVVTGRDAAGKPIFNAEFLHFAHHYGFTTHRLPPVQPLDEGQGGASHRLPAGAVLAGLPFHHDPDRPTKTSCAGLTDTANRRSTAPIIGPSTSAGQEEIPQLGALPATDYDTSLKVFRKVYRDCQISFNANRYVVPHRAVGRKVMLKVKNGLIRIYHDQDLLASYEEPQGKHARRGRSPLLRGAPGRQRAAAAKVRKIERKSHPRADHRQPLDRCPSSPAGRVRTIRAGR